MRDLRRDFGFVGRLFGVPREWLSRVGAFCSSWCVDSRIIKLTVPSNPDPDKDPVRIGIDEDALGEFVDSHLGDVGESQTDRGSYPTDEVEQKAETIWSSGGEKGAVVRIAHKVSWEDGSHKIYAAKLTFSKSGTLKKIETVKDEGWMI